MSTMRLKNKDGTWDKVPVLGSYQAVLAANEAATNAQNAASRVEYLVNGNFPYVTPQMFGAKADGITDDTQSIKDANEYLKENGGGTLFFPKGTYLIDTFSVDMTGTGVIGYGAIPIYSNIRYVGSGNSSIIKVANHPASEGFVWQGVFIEKNSLIHDASFENLVFNLNGSNNLFPAVDAAIREAAYSCAGIFTRYIENILISDCVFKECPGLNCIALGYSTHAIVKNCQFIDSADSIPGNSNVYDHSCILVLGNDVLVDGNTFKNANYSAIGTGIEVDGIHCRVTKNYVYNFNVGAIFSSVGITSIIDLICSCNHFNDNNFSIQIWCGEDAYAKNIIITDNIIKGRNTTANYDIDIYTHILGLADNILIANNLMFIDEKEADDNNKGAIIIGKNVHNVSIKNNRMLNYTGRAIDLQDHITNISIKANEFINCINTTNAYIICAILAQPNSSYIENVDISNNVAINKNIADRTHTFLWFLNDVRNISVSDNNVKGFNTDIDFGKLTTPIADNVIKIKHVSDGIVVTNGISAGSEIILQATNVKTFGNTANGRTYNKIHYNGLPNTGWANVGDIAYNPNPAAGSHIGWVCTNGGYSDTWVWKPFGAIGN